LGTKLPSIGDGATPFRTSIVGRTGATTVTFVDCTYTGLGRPPAWTVAEAAEVKHKTKAARRTIRICRVVAIVVTRLDLRMCVHGAWRRHVAEVANGFVTGIPSYADRLSCKIYNKIRAARGNSRKSSIVDFAGISICRRYRTDIATSAKSNEKSHGLGRGLKSRIFIACRTLRAEPSSAESRRQAGSANRSVGGFPAQRGER